MGKKCRVLFFIKNLSGGGAQKVLINLLKRLDPDQFELTLTTLSGGVYSAQVPPHVSYREIVHSRRAGFNALAVKILSRLPGGLFSRLFLDGDYDLIVAYLEGFPTRAVAKIHSSAPKAAFVHCDISQRNILAPYYADTRQCLAEYASFDRVCFVSNRALQGFEQTVGALPNATVVHNVQDVETIVKRAEEPMESAYSTSGLKILAAGRLSRPKRFDRLLEIAHRLQGRYSFEILILGEGEERRSLEEQIRREALTSVRLLGFRDNPYALMKQADLLVCSSEFEGYSTVVTEAMILGLPVVTTDCAGMDEILDNGRYGLIVDNDIDSLCGALEQVLSDKEVYADLKARARKGSALLRGDQALSEYTALFSDLLAMDA